MDTFPLASSVKVCLSGQLAEGFICLKPILVKSIWKACAVGAFRFQVNVRSNCSKGTGSDSVRTICPLQDFVVHSEDKNYIRYMRLSSHFQKVKTLQVRFIILNSDFLIPYRLRKLQHSAIKNPL